MRKSLKTNEVKVKRPKLVPVFELAQELLSATDVVIATPMWNWNCPAVLKAYIDAIIIPGVLGAGEGKLAGKRITVVISQGGAYGLEQASRQGWKVWSTKKQPISLLQPKKSSDERRLGSRLDQHPPSKLTRFYTVK